jgi:hypothetical protein
MFPCCVVIMRLNWTELMVGVEVIWYHKYRHAITDVAYTIRRLIDEHVRNL